MDEHSIGDLVLSYTYDGKAVLGVIRNEQTSPIDNTHNLYDILWLERENEIVSGYFTHATIINLKKNLDSYLYDYDKK